MLLRLRTPSSLNILTVLILVFIVMIAPPSAQAQEPQSEHTVFLPLIVRSGSSTPTPPPPPVQAALFFDTEYKTSSSSIQVDAQGGMHLAYYYYEPVGNNAPTYAVYFYCPTDCGKAAKWSGVSMGEQVNEVQLELTPAGQPRILYRTASVNRANGNDYYYAACDQNCTDPARWGLAYITTNGTAAYELRDDAAPQRYFALDPQGRPRFVYNDYVTGHLGTFYAFCDDDCTDGANWFETRINKDNGGVGNAFRSEKIYYPSLTFSPQGQPRLVAEGSSMQDEFYLFYLACEGGCEDGQNWQSLPLYARGSGDTVSYDIAIDAQGRSRLAFYQGALLGGQGEQLYYAWCNNANCLNGANWQARSLGLGQRNGQGPDLELDTAGRPRLAYALYDAGGLGYSWCNSNCDTPGGAWQQRVVESRAKLLTAWPVAYPPHCDGGLWDGLTPSLALDGAGNPRIAYDTTYHARCIYNPDTGEWDPVAIFHLIWRAVRINIFPQP